MSACRKVSRWRLLHHIWFSFLASSWQQACSLWCDTAVEVSVCRKRFSFFTFDICTCCRLWRRESSSDVSWIWTSWLLVCYSLLFTPVRHALVTNNRWRVVCDIHVMRHKFCQYEKISLSFLLFNINSIWIGIYSSCLKKGLSLNWNIYFCWTLKLVLKLFFFFILILLLGLEPIHHSTRAKLRDGVQPGDASCQ